MKQGGEASLRQAGFTIVEVLIVLAVSGLLFVSAVLYLSGKQNKTEFGVGIRQVQQQFQQLINETASGYYPNNGDFTCTSGGSSPLSIVKTGSTKQGAHGDCTFIGKVLIAGGSAHLNSMRVVPLAGRRVDSSAVGTPDVTAVAQAWPTVLAPGASNMAAPDMSLDIRLPNGIQFAGAKLNDGVSTQNIGSGQPFGVALVSSLAGFSSVPGASTGTQNFSLYGFTTPASWTPAMTSEDEVDAINAEAKSMIGVGAWNYKIKQAAYCFASGGTNQSGLVTVGDSAGGLGVTLDIKTGTSC